MNKNEFWWLAWGIVVAFGLQVLYDIVGESPSFSQRSAGGLTIEVVSIAILFGVSKLWLEPKHFKNS